MDLVDRVEHMISLVVHAPSDIGKLEVIIKNAKADAEGALKREAVAVKNAVTPELDAALTRLEDFLSHIPGLSALVKAHDVVEGVVAKVEDAAESAFHAVEAALMPAPAADAAKPAIL